MNKLGFITLSLVASTALAETDITSPDMKLGHWQTTVDQSAMIEDMLGSVPEESRAKMRQDMLNNSISYQCITSDSLENFDQQMQDAFSQQGGQDCQFDVSQSTKNSFIATLNCATTVISITTHISNRIRSDSTVVISTAGMPERKIDSVSEWQSSTCPDDS